MTSVKVLRKVAFIALPAGLVAAIVMAVLVEAWVRWSWDATRGVPGFFVTDAARGQRLAENYDGWFAGVPVRTNRFGFRSTREDRLEKAPNTFRILVLGDSVTFGHGAVHDYPALLEDALRRWRPDIDWQVWNLGVPGYNTAQELTYLEQVGRQYSPDLVVVGFFLNDIIANAVPHQPGVAARAGAAALAFAQRHWYSYEFYKRVVLTLAWRLSTNDSVRQRVESLETEEKLSATQQSLAEANHQQITPFDLQPPGTTPRACPDAMVPSAKDLAEMQQRDDWAPFVEAVRGFQALHAAGTYRIAFFLNIVPPVCPDGDWFYDARSLENAYFVQLFGQGTPVVSAYDRFLRAKPSQMPLAEAHSIGNSNQLKADVLFDFLRESGLLSAGGMPPHH